MIDMTITDITTATTPLRLVAVDLYRDIHKGIRSELFAITERAGNLDPSDQADRADLSAHVGRVVQLLVEHAEHEDDHIQPALEQHLPSLAEQVEGDHHRLEARIQLLAEQAADLVDAAGNARWRAHQLYAELASFTSGYLAHQDLEERVIMPSLEEIIGAEGGAGIHGAIIGSMAPEEMARGLAVMLPAMNVDDRTEMLGGVRAHAPAEVFQGVWSLAASVLHVRDLEALANRLGL